VRESRIQGTWDLLKKTLSEWIDDDAPRLGAALAFYTFFALAPILVISISIAALLFGQEAAQGRVLTELRGLLGRESAQAIQEMLEQVSKKSVGILASIGGALTALVGATGAFAELQASLNTIWGVKSPRRGILGWIRTRVLSFAMLLGVSFLMLVSLVFSTSINAFSDFLSQSMSRGAVLVEVLNLVLSFFAITLLFATIFRVLPDREIHYRDVWSGAILTTILFSLGKWLLGYYLGRAATASVYGAAWALAVVLLWTYYSAQIVFFGAEFTKVWKQRESQPLPAVVEGGQDLASPARVRRIPSESRPHRLKRPKVSVRREAGR
jgi:membrane protein